jgi:hypothetical protein
MSRDLAERVVYTLDEDAGVVTPDGKRDALLSGTEVVLAESTPAAPDEEGLDAAGRTRRDPALPRRGTGTRTKANAWPR